MQTCFEILGVSSSATKSELKRAYFSLVRVHTPEKDPEGFKIIRVAYDQALQAVEMDMPVFAPSDDPKERELQKTIAVYLDKEDAESAYKACRNAHSRYPKNPFFLYYMCSTMRMLDYNAVKPAEELLRMDPENRHYQIQAALCYISQGRDKRAWTLSKKILESGTRNLEFYDAYLTLLENRNAPADEYYTLLYPLITENECQKSEYLLLMKPLSVRLITAAADLDDAERQESAIRALTEFVRKNLNLLGDNPVSELCSELHLVMKEGKAAHPEVFKKAILSLQDLSKNKKEQDEIASIVSSFKVDTLMLDKRFPKCTHVLYRAYLMTPDFHPNAVKMDARLCGIMERDSLLACKDLLKKEYPDFYSKILPFLRSISTPEKAASLKDDLFNKYIEYDADYFPDRQRYFFEMYPDEKPQWMIEEEESLYYDEDDFDEEEAFHRLMRELFGL